MTDARVYEDRAAMLTIEVMPCATPDCSGEDTRLIAGCDLRNFERNHSPACMLYRARRRITDH